MKALINRNLLKGSFILVLGFGLFNFFHFLFQFFMARMLSISDYGVLATLFAVIYIFSIFTESMQNVVVKYSSNEPTNGKLKNILNRSMKKASTYSLIIFSFYLISAIFLANLLGISYMLLSVNGLVIFLALYLPITRGIMQGRKKFGLLSINMASESICKLILGLFFVFIGWKVYGAIFGVILGGSFSLLISFFQLKDVIKSDEKEADTIGIYNYAKPALLISAMIIIFYSLDVIIAKIFFEPEIAGAYAIASILGKIIFWGTLPISKAMFPMSAENKKNKTDNIFQSSFFILIFFIVISLLFFYFAPNFVIKIFSGKQIPLASSILFLLGISFSLISITNLILLHKLSINKIEGYKYLILFIFIEIILLSNFSSNLLEFSLAFITSSAAFLWGSLILIKE